MTGTPATKALADWVSEVTYDDLDGEVRHHTKRVLLDYLAAALSGARSRSAKLVQAYLSELSDRGSATVLGTSLAFSPPNAALANGTAAHGLEVDDGYSPGSFHPGAPNLSAILAAGQARGCSSAQILLATAVSFEVSCRIAAAGHPATWRRGFHNTPLAGVFGAAAGVAKLLRADPGSVASALGLAGSHAGGLFEFLADGAEVKRLHAGKAARDGLMCAELAVRGLTGPSTVLEGDSGYIRAFTEGVFDVDGMLRGLGQEWRMLRTYVKPYPCCRHLHGPIDALRKMAASETIELPAIREIEVETYGIAARHNSKVIRTLLDAQMSIPYAVAATLVHGSLGLEHFQPSVWESPDVRRLVNLVEVRAAEDCESGYPIMRRARVTLKTVNLRRAVQIDQPYGEPSNPVTDDDLEAKFLRLAGPVIGLDRAKKVARTVWAFEDPSALAALTADTQA